ncbi:MAG: DUF3164 family protein [Bacteroidales bacterium]|nr:DUF3164 family protein [Candidatus Scybalousia scybalohippi]
MEENKEKVTVEVTAEERAEFEKYMALKREKERQERLEKEKAEFLAMADEKINSYGEKFKELNARMTELKQTVVEDFKVLLSMKAELYGTKNETYSHMFTTSDGTRRVQIGVNINDDYDVTVEDGIAKVKEWISSLGNTPETQALVDMVLKLLSRDSKGTLKASRVMQLSKMAEDSNSEEFKEGMKIIRDAYSPTTSKTYVRYMERNATNEWVPVPLNMTDIK